MKFSVKSEYAVSAVLDMALHTDKGPVHVKAIAKRQAIPIRFLEQVMASLKKAGIVDSIRGAQGGYVLLRPPAMINVAHIVEAIEGPISSLDGSNGNPEDRENHTNGFVIKEVWEDVKKAVSDTLSKVSIDDMCKKKREREVTVMYHI
ncbi:MAG: RrF2 family transcriptional regulator [Nitrospira sp.]|nr:RrF2 family transcriptional regulator [Nitrospira sp.]